MLKMKIMFVVPPFPKRVREYLILPSIEVCIMSSILKNEGHEVRLVDMKITNVEYEELLAEVLQFQPDIICVEDEPKNHCCSMQVIDFIYKNASGIKIGMRGEISTFVPKTTLEHNRGLSFLLRSTDDFALSKIIKSGFQDEMMGKIPNIAFRDTKNNIIVTDFTGTDYSLDTLPLPDRRLYDVEKYLRRDVETIVKSCRGCPGNCLFCIKTRFERFQTFSISRFCDEIEELLKMGFQSFFIADDTFAFSDSRLEEFYQEVKRRNLKFKWTSNIRIRDINEFKLKRMKEIGAYRVFVGIETINADTQEVINKNLNAALIEKKIALLKEFDLEFHASFILGNPGDTEEDLEATVEFVRKIKPTLVTFNLIKIYPGLDLYDHPDRYGVILEDPYWYEKDDWTERVVMGTQELPPKVLEKWCRRCLWEFIRG